MPTNASKITLPLCHALATCQILFGYTFDEIEQKTSVKANSARKLMKCAIELAECNDFHKVLVCMSTIDRPERPTRVVDCTELSGNICKAMLVHNDLQPHVAVLDEEILIFPVKNPLINRSFREYNTSTSRNLMVRW